MHCPLCGKPNRPADRECQSCGEVLTPWRNIEFYGRGLRQRGLALAQRGDHLAACLSFLEAALTNPLDSESLVDSARSLVHLGRPDQALRLLAGVKSPRAAPAATALRDEIQRQQDAALAPEEPLEAAVIEDDQPAPVSGNEQSESTQEPT